MPTSSLRRRNLLAAALLASAGCASSGPSATPIVEPAAAQPVEFRRGIEGTQTVIQRGRPLGGTVQAPVQKAWGALQAAFDDLDLKPTSVVPQDGQLTVEGMRLVRFNDRRASYYADCGSDLSGPVADDSRVVVTILSAVQSAGAGGTIVATQVDVEARRRNGMEGVRDCTSTGKIEALILQQVRDHLKS